MTERRVYADGGTLTSRTVYNRVVDGGGSPITVDTYDGNLSAPTLLARSKHYFYGDAYQSMLDDPSRPAQISYSPWREGHEYQTENFDIVNGTPVIKQRLEQTWQQPSAGGSWPLTQAETDPSAKPNNPQLTRSVTSLLDTNPVLISAQSFGYDQYSNQTDIYETGNGQGAAPSYALRHTHIDYLTTNPQNGIDYPGTAHIIGLPTVQSTYEVNPSNGAETLLAQSETRYDEAAYAATPYGPVTGWVDPGTAARGLATTNRRWLNTTGGYIETHTEYDQAGNVRKSWDGRGLMWEIRYTDNYSDGVGRNTYAYPTQTISPVPDIGWIMCSTTALVTSTVYDYSTGLVTASTDANGKTTTIAYNDPFDRPTRVDRPDGGYTTYGYGNNVYGDYVHTQVLQNSAGLVTDSYSYTDRLGRPSRSFQYENSDSQNPWLTSDTQYDAMGRVWRASNTYRSAGSTAAINPSGNWTTTAYDALGRVTSVTTPDGAAVTTLYAGNSVTVTDQAGKKRSSSMDGLGRLAAVVEYLSDGSTYLTEYTYDALNNLRVVKQDTQRRYFMYDSLSRLIRARNPEQNTNPALALQGGYAAPGESVVNSQWSMAYGYDDNGNLRSRTDARGVTANYTYDNLNRNIRVAYPDTNSAFTDHYFDTAVNGRGRLRLSVAYANSTQAEAQTFINSYDVMGRVLDEQQKLWANGNWSAPYSVQRTYDVAGHVLTQTYPSGHSVSYGYDALGRTASFTGNLGDGVARTYMTALAFDDSGRMTRERFGTDTPLYNKRHYNVRGQLYDMRLSSLNDDSNWNRGAVVNYYSLANFGFGASGTDNNGNLLIQQHFIPTDDSIIRSVSADVHLTRPTCSRHGDQG